MVEKISQLPCEIKSMILSGETPLKYVRDIARDLGIKYILEGSVRQYEEKLR